MRFTITTLILSIVFLESHALTVDHLRVESQINPAIDSTPHFSWQLHSEKSDIPKGWSNWDFIILKGPLKIRDFINELENIYKIKINSIHSGNSMIYKNSDPEETKDLSVEKIYEIIKEEKIGSQKKYLIFNLNATDSIGNEVNLPTLLFCHLKLYYLAIKFKEFLNTILSVIKTEYSYLFIINN